MWMQTAPLVVIEFATWWVRWEAAWDWLAVSAAWMCLISFWSRSDLSPPQAVSRELSFPEPVWSQLFREEVCVSCLFQKVIDQFSCIRKSRPCWWLVQVASAWNMCYQAVTHAKLSWLSVRWCATDGKENCCLSVIFNEAVVFFCGVWGEWEVRGAHNALCKSSHEGCLAF